MRSNHTMSMDENAAWVLEGGYIRLSPLLKGVCYFPVTKPPVSISLTLCLLTPFPEGAIRTQQRSITWEAQGSRSL